MPALVNSSVGSLPGHERARGHDRVAVALEEIEERSAQFGAAHLLSRFASCLVMARCRRPGPARPGSARRKTRDIAGIGPVLHARGQSVGPAAPKRLRRGLAGDGDPVRRQRRRAPASMSASATPRSRSSMRMRSGPWPRAGVLAHELRGERSSESSRSATSAATTAAIDRGSDSPRAPRRCGELRAAEVAARQQRERRRRGPSRLVGLAGRRVRLPRPPHPWLPRPSSRGSSLARSASSISRAVSWCCCR